MPKNFFRRFTKKFFIISNIIVALLFLLGCYGYWFNPLLFWPVGFLTLGAFYFLMLLLLFMFFWLITKPRWSLISLVTMLLAFKPISNIIPFRFSSPFTKIKPENSLRIMSWNVAQFDILHKQKKPELKNEMFDLINEYQPDIACFQEMVCEDSSITQHGHVDEYLKRLRFPGYFYSYNNKEDFWDKAHFGIIIFSKYPIINKQTIMWYPNDYNSIIQYADIVKDADTFRVFNIHLQSLKFSPNNLSYIDNPELKNEMDLRESKNIISKFKQGFLKRKTQAEHIKEEMNKSPYKIILCGDFNDVPNSYAYHTIGDGLKNAFAEKGSGIGRTFTAISPTLRIDNIFVDDKIKVLQYARVKKKLSDHFPIIADLALEK